MSTHYEICLAEYTTHNKFYSLHHLCDYLGHTSYTLYHTIHSSQAENKITFNCVRELVDYLLSTSLIIYKHPDAFSIQEDIEELIIFLEDRKWPIN